MTSLHHDVMSVVVVEQPNRKEDFEKRSADFQDFSSRVVQAATMMSLTSEKAEKRMTETMPALSETVRR